MTPAWRSPPPNALRARLASRIVASFPASRDPTGAPKPLKEQTETVSIARTTLGPERRSCDFGVEEPRPTEVHLEAQASRLGGHRGELFERKDPAARDIVGVLQAKELRAGEVCSRA